MLNKSSSGMKKLYIVSTAAILIFSNCMNVTKENGEVICTVDVIQKFSSVTETSLIGSITTKDKRNRYQIHFVWSQKDRVLIAILKNRATVIKIDQISLISEENNNYIKLQKISPNAEINPVNLADSSLFKISIINGDCYSNPLQKDPEKKAPDLQQKSTDKSKKIEKDLKNLESLISNVESQVTSISDSI